jgi:hypothetical protein
MPPFAGQGLCAGVRDAANLAWKLDLVLAGQASEDVLDAYQDERLAHARGVIEFSMELGKVICVPDTDEAAARDAAMSAAVGPEPIEVPDLPGPTSGIVHPESPHAGNLFVQGAVGGRPFDDVHGAGWRLVSCGPAAGEVSAIADDLVEWFGAIGGKVVTIDGTDPVLGRWFDDHGTGWALQRPDFFLYGTATDAAGAGQLLTDLRTHLLDPSPEGPST